jgi:hypothetical protein
MRIVLLASCMFAHASVAQTIFVGALEDVTTKPVLEDIFLVSEFYSKNKSIGG